MAQLDFSEKKKKMDEEFDEYYGQYPADVSAVTAILDEEDRKRGLDDPFKVKALQYEILFREAQVKVFRHCPFYFEVRSGIARGRLGAKLPIEESGFGSWILERNRG